MSDDWLGFGNRDDAKQGGTSLPAIVRQDGVAPSAQDLHCREVLDY